MSFKDNLVDHARRSKMIRRIYLKVFSPYVDMHIKEISFSVTPRPSVSTMKRLNLLLPSISIEHVFGGINTALQYFEKIAAAGGFQRRIIVINAEPQGGDIEDIFSGYRLTGCEEDGKADAEILPCRKKEVAVPVSAADYFFSTAWWTAYCAQKMVDWQANRYSQDPRPIIYLIQDFEPGFYPWSSEYLIAESTYKYRGPQVALFNTKLLKDYFNRSGYHFKHEFYFEPVLNERVMRHKDELKPFHKKRQILVYGRPSTPRNAFSLILESLKRWAERQPDARQWKIISVGEKHRDMDLGHGAAVISKGKVSLAEYARLLAESSVGVSLMVSPHPSYPPLEMAEYGLHVITNNFQSKDLSHRYGNIISLERCMPEDIAGALLAAAQREPLQGPVVSMKANHEQEEKQLIGHIVDALYGAK